MDVASALGEFQQLGQGATMGSHAVATAPANMAKNRYNNVFPHDEHRVQLQEYAAMGLSSDYINASHIRLPGAIDSHFVAAQAPLPHTAGAFWLMVFELRIPLVVMLTRLMEMGLRKAHEYWPSVESLQFGAMRIVCEETSSIGGLQLRVIALHKRGVVHRVRHVQYMGWPDKGVPGALHDVAHLAELTMEWAGGQPNPVCVHCSAGVGRTGAFIAILHQLRLVRATQSLSSVNVPVCVLRMRSMRPGMVQTESQYVLVYRVLSLLFERLGLLQTQPQPQEAPQPLSFSGLGAPSAHSAPLLSRRNFPPVQTRSGRPMSILSRSALPSPRRSASTDGELLLPRKSSRLGRSAPLSDSADHSLDEMSPPDDWDVSPSPLSAEAMLV